MTLHAINKGFISGEITATERVKTYLKKIHENRRLNAFTCVFEDQALAAADDLDKRLSKGESIGPLAGCVIAVKDILNMAGTYTTCGSKILQKYISPYNATVIEKLIAADAIIIGKTNMDEFAMGSSTESSVFGAVLNPANEAHVPGGSSGGSAAAVAAGLADAAIGTDTGGSIRQPAAFTGIVGMKPSYGTVSRYGLVAYASSFDQIGPMTRNVEDAAYLLSIIAGHDERDSTSLKNIPKYFTEYAKNDIRQLRVGVFADGLNKTVQPEIRKSLNQTIALFDNAGCEVKTIELPHSEYGVAAYYILATAEASSNLARFDGIRYGHREDMGEGLNAMYQKSRQTGFGDEVRRRIMLGTYVLSSGYYDAYYRKAQQIRRLIKQDFDNAFKEIDVLLMPAAPTTAFKIGEKTDNPLAMYLSDVFTVTANLAGICGISVPVGKDEQGLPVGLQLLSAAQNESKILAGADFIERNRD